MLSRNLKAAQPPKPGEKGASAGFGVNEITRVNTICLSDFTSLAFFCLLTLIAFSAPAIAQSPSPDQIEFFESKVRPILVEHCYKCHSAEADEIEAGLVLDTKAGWETGGDSGPTIVPGNLDESLLVQAIRYDEDVVTGMPPKSKLSDDKIAILERWVSMGAPDPRTGQSAAEVMKAFDLQGRFANHWSWRRDHIATAP